MSLISFLAHLDMCSQTSVVVEPQTSQFCGKQAVQIKIAKSAKSFCTGYYAMLTNPHRIDLLFRGMFYQEEHAKRLMHWASQKSLSPARQIKILENFTNLTCSGAYYHGLAPKDVFEIPDDKSMPTGKKVMEYALKKVCPPSRALDRVLHLKKGEIFFVDCTLICQMSVFKALQETIPDKFDTIFGSDSPVPFMLSRNSSLFSVLLTVVPRDQVEKIEVGDWVCFANVPKYSLKHYNGDAAKMNVLCVSSTPLFTGLGLNPKGVTRKEIYKLLLEEYNEAPTPTFAMPQSVKESQKEGVSSRRIFQEDTIGSIEEFIDAGGGQIVGHGRMHFNRVQELVDASVEEGFQLLSKWKSELQRRE
jgi:hypothetical protein